MSRNLNVISSLLVGALFTFAAAQTPPPEPVVTELGSGGTQITFWNGLSGSDGVTLNTMLEQFVAENPDVSVRTEIIDWATLYPKLQAAFVAGDPPDVFVLHESEIPQFQSVGVLKDLSYLYDTNGGPLPAEDFAQPGYDGIQVDGVPYGVLLDNHGRGTFANLGLFEAAGVEPTIPDNYEDLVAMLQQLTLDTNGNNAASPDFDPQNVAQWGTAHEWVYHDFEGFLWQHGGSIMSEDGTTATVNSEEAITALQKLYDLTHTYHVAPPPAGFDAWQSWAGGKVAIVPSGTWFRNFAVDQTDIEWQALPFFQAGEEPSTWLGAHTFMLPASAEGAELEAAERMIEWVSNNQTLWAASGQVPARISAQEALNPEDYPSNIVLGETFQQYGKMSQPSTAILEITAALDPELLAAMNGDKSVEQALNDANARIQGILDRIQ